jgi:hypothetical protein
MTTIDWYGAARSRIVPRTPKDLANANRRKRFTEWREIKKAIPDSLEGGDDAIGAALTRIRTAETPPNDVTALEMQVVLAATGAPRSFRFLAQQWGAPSVAAVLASPSLASEWDMTRRAYVLAAQKAPFYGALLRELFLAEDARGREDCRLAIESTWEAGDVATHERLAIALLEHEPWRARALAEILDQAPAFATTQLVLARDAETMHTLLARRKPTDPIEYTEIVANLDEAAFPLLVELAKTATKSLHLSHTYAVSVFATEEAARHLAACISYPSTRDLIGNYFERHKELARAVLPAASQGASRNAALAKALMIKACGPSAAPEEDTVPLEDPALPSVLRDAPWRHPPPPLPDLGLDLAAYPTSAVLSEKRKAEGLAWLTRVQQGRPEMTPEEVAAYKTAHAADKYAWYLVNDGKCIPLEVILEFFCEGRWHNIDVHLALLDRFGVRALPALRQPKMMRQLAEDVLLGLDDPAFAHPLAALVLEDGVSRWSWFAEHPRAAALGLLAVVHDPAKRRASEIMLRRMAEAGHRELILETARGSAEVRAFLDRDPRLDAVDVPKVTRVTVTRPRLLDGRALGDDAIERILEMLALSQIDHAHAGIADVKAVCEPRSLAEMAWDLAALADAGGRGSRAREYPEWMRHGLVPLADDEVIRRLTPALKHETIYRVLETLARRGVTSATMELATAHERGDSVQSMGRVARAFNQTVDELVETILPTIPLEADGAMTLQYGSRPLRVGFDTTLAPTLSSGDQRLASLPRAKKEDDPIVVRLARERWEELKEDVRTIAHLRGRSLEGAMRTARTIRTPHFLAGWAAHPLGKHLARGMVWSVDGSAAGGTSRTPDGRSATGLVTFRVTEDGSFADIHDEALSLEEGDLVRVPHPAELSREVKDAWLQTFGDYGLIQPVAQLGRTPLAIELGEEQAQEIIRNLALPIPYTAVTRVLSEQGGRTRALTRGSGVAHFDIKTKWVDQKTMVEQIKLVFRDAADAKVILLPSSIHPVELAESLYVLRLLLEAS